MKISLNRIIYIAVICAIGMLTFMSVLPYADTGVELGKTCTASDTQQCNSDPLVPPNRSILEALYLHVGIRVKWAYLQWFGLKAILKGVNSTPSPYRPANVPKFDTYTNVGFMTIWTIAGFARDQYLVVLYAILTRVGFISVLNKFQDHLSDRIIRQMKEAGYERNGAEIPIPEFDWQHKTPEEFYETFAKIRHPVVLRGFMKDKPLLKELSWDSIMRNFSDERVFLTSEAEDGYEGKMKDVDDPKTYLHNSELLFMKYPQIRTLFEYKALEPYLRMKIGYEQLFIGREGTGTPFHHAHVYNWFYQIDGVKKWWFIDPYDTLLAYPVVVFGRAAAMMNVLFPYEG